MDRHPRGLARGADGNLVPERPFDVEEVRARLRRRDERGRSPIVVVSEGAVPRGGTWVSLGDATDAFGHARLGGIGVALEGEIERRTGYETRVTILGHVQRGGTPVAFDRVLATRFGVAAMDAVADGTLRSHGRPAWHRHRRGGAGGCAAASRSCSIRDCMRRRSCSLAEGCPG